MTEESARWTAHFIFHNTPLTELELRNSINNVEFITEPWQPRSTDPLEVKLIGFNIIIPNATMQKARFEAEGKANVIFNYLTGVHRYPIRGHLTNMTSDKGQGIATIEVGATIHKSMSIDLADINRLIEGSNEKYLRQLAHYSRGVEAADVITKFREFYQVFEEDIGIVTPPKPEWKSHKELGSLSIKDIEDYEILTFIRHLLNHPNLTSEKAKVLAGKLAVKTSLNLNNPEELELVKSYLKIMQEKAKDIIEGFATGK
jgi:hypothetical protein